MLVSYKPSTTLLHNTAMYVRLQQPSMQILKMYRYIQVTLCSHSVKNVKAITQKKIERFLNVVSLKVDMNPTLSVLSHLKVKAVCHWCRLFETLTTQEIQQLFIQCTRWTTLQSRVLHLTWPWEAVGSCMILHTSRVFLSVCLPKSSLMWKKDISLIDSTPGIINK